MSSISDSKSTDVTSMGEDDTPELPISPDDSKKKDKDEDLTTEATRDLGISSGPKGP